MNDGLHTLTGYVQDLAQSYRVEDKVMITTQMLRMFCGVGMLCGLMAVPTARVSGGDLPVQTLTHRVIDDQPAAIQQVSHRYGGYSRFGYGRFGYSRYGYGYRPSYYGYSYYQPYRSFSRAPAFGYSYYRPRYYGNPLYRAPYYGYSYYRPSLFALSYYRPAYYGGNYARYGYPRVRPTYRGLRYHGSYGYGSACCN